MEKAESKRDHLTQTIVLLAALISLAVNIVTASGGMSSGAQRIILPSTIVIAACCIYAVFGQTCVVMTKRILMRIRHWRLVPRHFAKFEVFAVRFRQLCDRSYCDTVPSSLRDFPSLWNGGLTDSPALSHLADYAEALRFMVTELPRSKRNLLLSIKWFDLTLHMYDRQCVCEPVKQIRAQLDRGIGDDKKRRCDQLKQGYQKAKLGYVMFREQYAEFARDINRAFGESVAREYYEKPDDL